MSDQVSRKQICFIIYHVLVNYDIQNVKESIDQIKINTSNQFNLKI